jgi:hypothetical protein
LCQAAQVEPVRDTNKKGVDVSTFRADADSVYNLAKVFRNSLATQDRGFNILLQKAATLEVWVNKSRSPEAKIAIEALLKVISGMKNSQDEVHMTFNTMSQRIPKTIQVRGPPIPAVATTCASTHTVGTGDNRSTQTETESSGRETAEGKRISTEEAATDTPCWGDVAPVRLQPSRKCTSSMQYVERKGPKKNGSKKEPTHQHQEPPTRQRMRDQLPPSNLDSKEVSLPLRAEQEFTLVETKKSRRRRAKADSQDVNSVVTTQSSKKVVNKRRRIPKTQTVVLEKPPNTSYSSRHTEGG